MAAESTHMREQDVGKYIQEKIKSAKLAGQREITLISGDIQGELCLKDGLPEICAAMRNLMEPGDTILHQAKSARCATLAIRYELGNP